jgi:hypothetical protein
MIFYNIRGDGRRRAHLSRGDEETGWHHCAEFKRYESIQTERKKHYSAFLKISKTKLLHHSSNRKTAKWTFRSACVLMKCYSIEIHTRIEKERLRGRTKG